MFLMTWGDPSSLNRRNVTTLGIRFSVDAKRCRRDNHVTSLQFRCVMWTANIWCLSRVVWKETIWYVFRVETLFSNISALYGRKTLILSQCGTPFLKISGLVCTESIWCAFWVEHCFQHMWYDEWRRIRRMATNRCWHSGPQTLSCKYTASISKTIQSGEALKKIWKMISKLVVRELTIIHRSGGE